MFDFSLLDLTFSRIGLWILLHRLVNYFSKFVLTTTWLTTFLRLTTLSKLFHGFLYLCFCYHNSFFCFFVVDCCVQCILFGTILRNNKAMLWCLKFEFQNIHLFPFCKLSFVLHIDFLSFNLWSFVSSLFWIIVSLRIFWFCFRCFLRRLIFSFWDFCDLLCELGFVLWLFDDVKFAISLYLWNIRDTYLQC